MIISWIEVMMMGVPSLFVKVQLDIASEIETSDFDVGIKKVRTSLAVPYSWGEDFYGSSIEGS